MLTKTELSEEYRDVMKKKLERRFNKSLDYLSLKPPEDLIIFFMEKIECAYWEGFRDGKK